MSLADLLFGLSDRCTLLLGCLGLTADQVPCLRDCYLRGRGIHVRTRSGGKYREYYESPESRRVMTLGSGSSSHDEICAYNEDLRRHPEYIIDFDELGYAIFVFTFPGCYARELTALSEHEMINPSPEWVDLLKRLCLQDCPNHDG